MSELIFIPKDFKKILAAKQEDIKLDEESKLIKNMNSNKSGDDISEILYSVNKSPCKRSASFADIDFNDMSELSNPKLNVQDFEDQKIQINSQRMISQDENEGRTYSFNGKIKDVKPNSMNHIPCLYLPYIKGSSKILIYFHGNAEDIGVSKELLDYVRSLLRIHVIAVEYPGYGVYQGSPDANQIMIDAEIVLDYLIDHQGIPPSQIILCGRSIGTGPATYLASKKQICSLLLIAPFTSIRDLAKEISGRMLQYFVNDRFRNIDLIQKVKCPTFILHGQKDTLIPLKHSEELHYKCGGPCALITPKDMDHNNYDYLNDLIIPFSSFLKKCNITVCEKDGKSLGENGIIQFDKTVTEIPIEYQKCSINKGSIWNWFIRKIQN